jgi:putative membrane protein
VIGLGLGAVMISFGISWLFKRFYTATFSVIFGIFLTMIPNMLNENCILGKNWMSVISLILLIVGFTVSFYLGNWDKRKKK